MIENGDRIFFFFKIGGLQSRRAKDRYSLLDTPNELRARSPIEFESSRQPRPEARPGFRECLRPQVLAGLGVDFRIVEQDTYRSSSARYEAGRCADSCSRLRRGALTAIASELARTR